MQPSPLFRRVGIRNFTFEACSDFTRITARWIAQPPKAAFVTRLQPRQLPGETARQLPDQSTTIWVDPSSTGKPRPRGALNKAGLKDIAEIDPRLEKIIECRYFAGLTVQETAEALDIAVRTVERDGQRAKGYLLDMLEPDSQ
jgi:DNA-directed RNA polymerase specialized sigma24 family protein